MKKDYIVGMLGYNRTNGRYGLLVSDLWEHTGFHCGDRLEVMISGKWVETTMEMDKNGQWYLAGIFFKGDLEYLRARIPA